MVASTFWRYQKALTALTMLTQPQRRTTNLSTLSTLSAHFRSLKSCSPPISVEYRTTNPKPVFTPQVAGLIGTTGKPPRCRAVRPWQPRPTSWWFMVRNKRGAKWTAPSSRK